MSARIFTLSLVVLMAIVSHTGWAQSPIEVLYIQQNNELLTYDVDPLTLQGELVGQPFSLPAGEYYYVRVFPSSNDHFIYVLAGEQLNQMSLYLYGTDDSGVPQAPAVQTLGPAPISDFAIDPDGRFAYWIEYNTNSQTTETAYEMRLFNVDASTGKLTESPQVQVSLAPNFWCSLIFQGFDPNGAEMQYAVWCSPPAFTYGATYYERSVNQQTGQLGAASAIFSFYDGTAVNTDTVGFGRRDILDLRVRNTEPSMEIYALSGGAPLIRCDSAMLAQCGEASSYRQDVTGEWLFLSVSPWEDLVKVDLTNRRIEDTGYSLPEQGLSFTPDDRILYGGPYGTVQIYGFDAKSGTVTTGGQIPLPPNVVNSFMAVRK